MPPRGREEALWELIDLPLELRSSGLRMDNARLVELDRAGNEKRSFPIRVIESIEFQWRLNRAGPSLACFLVCIALACGLVISGDWGLALTTIFAASAWLTSLGWWGPVVKLKTANELATFACQNSPAEDVIGFADSARLLLERPKVIAIDSSVAVLDSISSALVLDRAQATLYRDLSSL